MSVLSYLKPERTVSTYITKVNEILCLEDGLLETINVGDQKSVDLGYGREMLAEYSDLGLVSDFDSVTSIGNTKPTALWEIYRGTLVLNREAEDRYKVKIIRITVDEKGNDETSPHDTVERFSFDMTVDENDQATISHIHDSQSIVGFHEMFTIFEVSVRDFVEECLQHPEFADIKKGTIAMEQKPLVLIRK